MKNYILIPSDMRNQDEVLDLLMSEGPSGYGVFIMVCEFLRECEGYKTRNDANRLAYALRIADTSLVDRVLHNYGLFLVDDQDMINCPVFSSSMEGYDRKREASRKAAEARWQKREGNASNNANAMQTHNNGKSSSLGSQCETPPNSINSIVEKSTNQSKIVTFGGACKVDRDALDKISREVCRGASEELLAKIDACKDDKHNGGAVVSVSRAFRLSDNQTKLLYQICQGGLIGSPNLEDALAAMRQARTMTTPVKYPFNYLLSKLRTYDK